MWEAHCLTEWLVVGKPGLVDRFDVQLGESLALLLGDLEVTVHVDQGWKPSSRVKQSCRRKIPP
jgi:hypothetical protein